MAIFIFGVKVLVLGALRAEHRGKPQRPPLRGCAFFKFHRGRQFGWGPQNLFCPSVLLYLEQLSKVAQGSSCKHTNLPLKSRPWGSSGTLLINSESHQRACSPLWRYEPALPGSHLPPRRDAPTDPHPTSQANEGRTKGTWHLKGWLKMTSRPHFFLFCFVFFFRRQFLHGSLMD